jgi:nucleoside 2-deoxyribosyltransferase
MSKKYQVFVSSTYEDLVEERKEVSQAILECDCFPSGMELFPASNNNQWTVIKKVIDDCDYFLLIIAGSYGSLGIDDEGNRKSYTEMEFDYAVKKGKPVIAFFSDIAVKKDDAIDIQSLENFRKKVKDDKLIKYWKSKDELHKEVLRSLQKLINENPAQGWIKPDKPGDPSANLEELLNSSIQLGIIAIHPDGKSAKEILKNKISGKIKSLKILVYYGDVFLKTLKEEITAVETVQLLIAKKDSTLLNQVWDMETANKDNLKNNNQEGKVEVTKMENAVEYITEKKMGKFECREYSTQIRYALIVVNERWAWWTPYHPGIEVKDTPSFELINKDDASLINTCIKHFDLLWEKSPNRKNNV